ncbi:hypothetical protein AB4Z46_31475 [Variovorax sp. M-6]|uniref:hypothetical protein n=1 Tax=Variovorax sp. M-6 TaxID=3233041 RepID=UPI003F9E3D10
MGCKAIVRPRADHGWARNKRRPELVRRIKSSSSDSRTSPRSLADELIFVRTRPRGAGTENSHASPEEQTAEIGRYLRSLAGAPECYISVNTFFGWRRHENLKHLTCLMVDLDLSKALERGHDYAGDFMAMRQCALDAISDAGIPTPNLSTHTGRGVHLYWLFDRTLPAAAAPRWLACLKVLIKLLHPFGADASVSDTARVLRLVGTVNSSAPPHCRRVTAEVLVAKRVAFDFLADQILPLTRAELAEARSARLIELAPKRALRDARRQLRGQVSDAEPRRPGRSFSATATARLTDLNVLAEALFPQGVTKGNRDRYLFAVTCNLAWMCREDTLEPEVLAWKARHIPDMTDGEALTTMGSALRKAKESYEARAVGAKCRPYDDPRYLHSAATLWQMFGRDIESAGLVAAMQAILPEGVLRERRRAARRAKSPDHYTRQGIRVANVPRALQALDLRGEGQSLREIARALSTSPKTIAAWLELPPEALGLVPAQMTRAPAAAPRSASPPLAHPSAPPSYPQNARVLAFARQVSPKCSLTNGSAERVMEKASQMQVAGGGSGGSSVSFGLAVVESALEPQALDAIGAEQRRTVARVRVASPLQAVPSPRIGMASGDREKPTGPRVGSTPAFPLHAAALAADTRADRPRDKFSEELLRELRGWSLRRGLEAIGLHFKVDATFTPLTSDQRIHVTRGSGQVLELVVTNIRWFDVKAGKGGGGVIDLAMHVMECDFVAAIRTLTKHAAARASAH